MKNETCVYCLDGRHRACADVLTCACNVCRLGGAKSKPNRPRSSQPARSRRKANPKKRGVKPGQEWYKAHSTEQQREWVRNTYLHSRLPMTQIARIVGLSRDQVRLILEKSDLLAARPSRTVDSDTGSLLK